SVSIRVLKNKLSEYVRLAASGEVVLVTHRDRVVAELVPPHAGRGPMLSDATLAEGVPEGWVTPPVSVDDRPPPRKPVASLSEVSRRPQACARRRVIDLYTMVVRAP